MASMAVMGCTGKNPDFAGSESTSTGSTDTMSSTRGDVPQPTEGPTSAPTDTEPNPDTTDTLTGSDSESSETSSTETSDCKPYEIELLPIRDNFLVTNGNCGLGENLPCEEVSFGSTSTGFISGPGGGRLSYLLITFELGGFETFEEDSGSLVLWIEDTERMFNLQVTPVFPGTWAEGFGDNGVAVEDASSWNWSRYPTPWQPDDGIDGDFQEVLSGAMPLPAILMMSQGGLSEYDYPIPAEVLADRDDFGRVNLAVTVLDADLEVRVHAADAVSLTPRLRFVGC